MIIAIASDKFHPDVNPPNVVVPYANADSSPGILAAVKLNLEAQGLYPRYVNLTEDIDTNYAYYRLLKSLWAEGKPFILVEHDIVPWPTALRLLWECPCAWGAYRYAVLGSYAALLGCVKFDPSRLGAFPLSDEPVPWQLIDRQLIRELTKCQQAGHVHNPPVSHLNYGHQMMTRSLRVPNLPNGQHGTVTFGKSNG